jgi:putative transposase
VVCRKLEMTRQNYYQRRRQRQRRNVDEELVINLIQEERKLQPRLGVRKLHFMFKKRLGREEVKTGRDRLFKLLGSKEMLLKRQPAQFPRTTSSYHCLPVFKNLIRDMEVSKPNQVWVGDLTYLRTGEGFLYLALLTDKSSRKIVGYHCGDTLEAAGCLKALEMALSGMPPGATPIHHSDRGSQYCCHEYVNRLGAKGLRVSMTEVDHCAENALAERMNGILKSEYGFKI